MVASDSIVGIICQKRIVGQLGIDPSCSLIWWLELNVYIKYNNCVLSNCKHLEATAGITKAPGAIPPADAFTV